MNDQQLAEFASLWGADANKYVLVSVQPRSTDLRHCVIVNRHGVLAKLIEDEELAIEVMRRMVKLELR